MEQTRRVRLLLEDVWLGPGAGRFAVVLEVRSRGDRELQVGPNEHHVSGRSMGSSMDNHFDINKAIFLPSGVHYQRRFSPLEQEDVATRQDLHYAMLSARRHRAEHSGWGVLCELHPWRSACQRHRVLHAFWQQ